MTQYVTPHQSVYPLILHIRFKHRDSIEISVDAKMQNCQSNVVLIAGMGIISCCRWSVDVYQSARRQLQFPDDPGINACARCTRVDQKLGNDGIWDSCPSFFMASLFGREAQT